MPQKRYVVPLPPEQVQKREEAARTKLEQAFTSRPPEWFRGLEVWTAEDASLCHQAHFWLTTTKGKVALMVKPTRGSRKRFMDKNSPLPPGLVVISVEPSMVDDEIFRVLARLLGIN